MKVLIVGNKARFDAYLPEDIPFAHTVEKIYVSDTASNEEVAAKGREAELMVSDPMRYITADLLDAMPNLKMVHSEGVGYDKFDLTAARERGIYVCNCAGANGGAVAEQTILLMMALVRNLLTGDRAVRQGRQIDMKLEVMAKGQKELADLTIGLVGLGAIGIETARRLAVFGCKVLYYSRSPKPELATELGVEYRDMDDLLAESDVISLHVPVTSETRQMVNQEFLSKVKDGAILINTSRGDLLDQEAVREALISGKLAGAGLDVLSPEPMEITNPLIDLPEEARDRMVYSPHIAGNTRTSLARAHWIFWKNFSDYAEGKTPKNIVNGL